MAATLTPSSILGHLLNLVLAWLVFAGSVPPLVGALLAGAWLAVSGLLGRRARPLGQGALVLGTAVLGLVTSFGLSVVGPAPPLRPKPAILVLVVLLLTCLSAFVGLWVTTKLETSRFARPSQASIAMPVLRISSLSLAAFLLGKLSLFAFAPIIGDLLPRRAVEGELLFQVVMALVATVALAALSPILLFAPHLLAFQRVTGNAPNVPGHEQA